MGLHFALTITVCWVVIVGSLINIADSVRNRHGQVPPVTHWKAQCYLQGTLPHDGLPAHCQPEPERDA